MSNELDWGHIVADNISQSVFTADMTLVECQIERLKSQVGLFSRIADDAVPL